MPLRDIAVTLLFAACMALLFKHPAVGTYLWAWLSVMTPQTMTYGFARGFSFAQYAALATLAVFVWTNKKQTLPWNGITQLWVALVGWMSFTSLFSLAPEGWVLERWIFVMKIQLMMAVTLMLVRTEKELKILVCVVTLSLAYFGVKGGVFTLQTGGGARVWGPGNSLLGGNNELAVGLTMIVPFLYWMRQTFQHQPRWGVWIRRAMTVAIVLCCFSILGSQSRGGFLAVLAIALFLGVKSAHPVRVTAGIVTLVAVAVAFMPDTWSTRMDTIKTYKEDDSAMSRLYTWRTLANAAIDRPIVGAGFRAHNRAVFGRYGPKGEEWANFHGRIWVAHSIYFQMLGEHGFVGFGIWLAFWFAVWRSAGRIARDAEALDGLRDWVPLLMRMSQVSIVGYAAGGAFLSLAYLDVVYYIAGYVLLSGMLVARAQRAAPSRPAVAPLVPAAGAGPARGAAAFRSTPGR